MYKKVKDSSKETINAPKNKEMKSDFNGPLCMNGLECVIPESHELSAGFHLLPLLGTSLNHSLPREPSPRAPTV